MIDHLGGDTITIHVRKASVHVVMACSVVERGERLAGTFVRVLELNIVGNEHLADLRWIHLRFIPLDEVVVLVQITLRAVCAQILFQSWSDVSIR